MTAFRTRDSVRLIAVLTVITLLVGCNAFSRKVVEGPYVDYLFLTAPEVRNKLGAPDAIESFGRSEFWSYESRGLHLHFFEGELLSINQFKGKVTSEITIGDDESSVREIAGEGAQGKPGVRIFTIEKEGVEYVLVAQDGTIVRARISLPSSP